MTWLAGLSDARRKITRRRAPRANRASRRGLDRHIRSRPLRLEPLEHRWLLSAGTLDPTFGGDGKVITPFGSGIDRGQSIAVQGDGKIVVAGYANTGTTTGIDFAVVRYNPDGTLDATFNGGGKVTTPLGTSSDMGRAMALQSDGKIVVAGYSYGSSLNDFAVARYNADGSVDTAFGGDGKALVNIGASTTNDYGRGVALQSDGKIVVAGYYDKGSNSQDFAVVRLNANGTLDSTFSAGGKATTEFHPNQPDFGTSVAVQSDGKIVVAGYSFGGANYRFAVARYNVNGSLDNSFDGDGKLTTAVGSGDAYANSVAVQADGKIVVAGNCQVGSTWDVAVVRYNPNGSLDNSFDGDGKVTTAIGSGTHDYGQSLAIQGDGKIVVAGYSTYSSDPDTGSDFAVLRYHPDGSLDDSFGNGGMLTTDVGSGTGDCGFGVALQTDGKIVVAGSSAQGSNVDFAVVRYLGDEIATPPAVVGVTVNDGAAQRSMVTSVTVSFDRAVGLAPGAFELLRRDGPAVRVRATLSPGATDAVLTFDVDSDDTYGDALSDGIYDLTVRSDYVVDAQGGQVAAQPLTGLKPFPWLRRLPPRDRATQVHAIQGVVPPVDGFGTRGENGSPCQDRFPEVAPTHAQGIHLAEDYVFTFHRLYGDADGDADVDGADLMLFRGTYGMTEGTIGYLWYFDHDGDGDADSDDYAAFRANYRQRLIY